MELNFRSDEHSFFRKTEGRQEWNTQNTKKLEFYLKNM